MTGDGILVRNDRDPLYGLGREGFIEALREKLRGRVGEAWVFGSFARGELGPDSDIDLMLVARTERPFTQRGLDFLDIMDIGPRIDFLIYTPEEFARLRADPTDGFWKSACAEMKRIL